LTIKDKLKNDGFVYFPVYMTSEDDFISNCYVKKIHNVYTNETTEEIVVMQDKIKEYHVTQVQGNRITRKGGFYN
jgi:CBS domain containing-hemolysin-like protein